MHYNQPRRLLPNTMPFTCRSRTMRKLTFVFPALTAILCLVAHELSAQKDQGAKDGGAKPFEIKGEAKRNAHPQKLEKGVTYRIVVKAEGFVPTLHIGDQFGVSQSA